jgi:hypothetical protein
LHSTIDLTVRKAPDPVKPVDLNKAAENIYNSFNEITNSSDNGKTVPSYREQGKILAGKADKTLGYDQDIIDKNSKTIPSYREQGKILAKKSDKTLGYDQDIIDKNSKTVPSYREQGKILAGKADKTLGYDQDIIDKIGAGAEANFTGLQSTYDKKDEEVNGDVGAGEEAEFSGLQSVYEQHSTGYIDKYIDCGIAENTVKGGQYSEAELDALCEELKKSNQEKYLKYGAFLVIGLIVLIVLFNLFNRKIKVGFEFQKMAEAFNGIYGVISAIDVSGAKKNLEEKKQDILYCAFISKKEILDRIELYKWNELTPINIPLISNSTINIKLALNKTVREINNLAAVFNLEEQVEEIISKGDLYYEFEKVFNPR